MTKEKSEDFEDDFEFLEDEEEAIVKGREAGDAAKKLREELKKCQREREEYLTGWQRAKADLINERQDAQKKQGELAKFATVEFAMALFPVIDSFEMAMKERSWEDTPKNWRDGIMHVYNQLLGILKDNKIEQLNPEGTGFDPTYHESVEAVLTEDKEKDNMVMEVLQRGYILDGKVLRPARVKVAQFKNS